MTANGNIHRTKERDDLVCRDSELPRHVVYAKLAQPFLPLRNAVRGFSEGFPETMLRMPRASA